MQNNHVSSSTPLLGLPPVLLPEDIYAAHLTTINGVKFTLREVDVVACRLNGRSKRKEIARFLSISENTVRTHMQNISTKIGGDLFVNFIERSPYYSLIKNSYYSNLCISLAFEKSLKAIAGLKHNNHPKLFVVYWQDQTQKSVLLGHLKKHLLRAGIRFQIKDYDSLSLGEDRKNLNQNTIWLIRKEKEEKKKDEKSHELSLQNMPIIVTEHLHYYFLVFDILKKSLPDLQLEGYFSKFEKEYVRLQNTCLVPSPHKLRYFTLIMVFLLVGSLLSGIEWVFKYRSAAIYSPQDLLKVRKKEAIFPQEVHNLPRPNAYFSGRREILQKIKQTFDKEHTLVVLVGFLGTGKTQIAKQFAEENKKDYDLIWRIDAKSNIINQFKDLALQLNDSGFLSDQQTINVNAQAPVLLEKIQEFLKTSPKKWLIIFDNVQNRGDILDFLPPKNLLSLGHILITTRNEEGWVAPLKIGILYGRNLSLF